MRRPARFDGLLLNRRQTATIISPARLEVVEAIAALGRASARELAVYLGRPPGAIYHHVRVLEQAGVIAEVGRRGPRRPEAIYAPVATRLAVPAGMSPEADRQALQTIRAVLRQAGRDVDAAFARGAATLKGRFHGAQFSAALKPRDVKRVLALLAELDDLLRRAKRVRPRPTDEVFRWTSVFVPLERRR
jgi:DNA-binding transcriptional ArsR family regulator